MLRKIGFSLLCAATALSTSMYATTTQTLRPAMTVDYELIPNDPLILTNYLYWEIKASCKITTVDESNELIAEALAKQGKVNDVVLSQGNSMSVTVHQNDILRISAEKGAQVKITNLGQHTIKASCST